MGRLLNAKGTYLAAGLGMVRLTNTVFNTGAPLDQNLQFARWSNETARSPSYPEADLRDTAVALGRRHLTHLTVGASKRPRSLSTSSMPPQTTTHSTRHQLRRASGAGAKPKIRTLYS